MGQFHWDPDSYLELMRRELPDYERLQTQAVAASRGAAGRAPAGVKRILELGTGTGESAKRVLAAHPGPTLTGIDASERMLSVAREMLSRQRVTISVGRLEDPLPPGPFDLVVSVLAVHHLDGAGKASLFGRIAGVLAPRGRFVLGDLIVPEDPADAVTPMDGSYDQPSRLGEQLQWLHAAGFGARVHWRRGDLAVVVADLVRPSVPPP
jgi:tRNA (cmo5U34)-methyltransferase